MKRSTCIPAGAWSYLIVSSPLPPLRMSIPAPPSRKSSPAPPLRIITRSPNYNLVKGNTCSKLLGCDRIQFSGELSLT
ncbi:MAG TPA: hypothetical protein DCF68_10380 [Cyanothece sp. UBA12306]|nr:hypothetical protein [Cyanothece sp. UBA12306]